MSFNEPKVEYVSLPVEMFTTSASCTDSVTCQQYGVETCLGAAPMNQCSDDDNWL